MSRSPRLGAPEDMRPWWRSWHPTTAEWINGQVSTSTAGPYFGKAVTGRERVGNVQGLVLSGGAPVPTAA